MVRILRSIARKTPIVKKYIRKSSHRYERFVKIPDKFSGKSIYMYLKEESYMEKEFMQHGLYGKWEKESLKIWAHLSKQSTHILDLGANTGVFSLIAAVNNCNAFVYAVEPIFTNYDVLVKNINKNNCRIHPEKTAISNEVGEATMYMLENKLNYMTSVNDNRYALHPEIQRIVNADVVEVKVPVTTYSELKKKYNIPKLDLIKIDVEGHEFEVLNNMYDEIKADKPNILIEVIGDENATELNNMFRQLDYQFVSIDEENISKIVTDLWDNDHHNFLLCNNETILNLKEAGLLQ